MSRNTLANFANKTTSLYEAFISSYNSLESRKFHGLRNTS